MMSPKLPEPTQLPRERAFLVGVEIRGQEYILPLSDSLTELARLADTAGLEVVGELTQKLERPNPQTLLGSGKVEELKALVEDTLAEVVIFDDELSPRHQRELERVLGPRVRVLDRRTGQVVTLTPSECRFRYRDSVFKTGEPGRYIVLAVQYRLARGGAPALRYAEVVRDLAARGVRSPSLGDVRRSVLDIRRSKSMVLDPGDPNHRSCGSFFVNPIVTAEELRRIRARARAHCSR